ncbi:MAG TPA: hypothetical protein VLA03_01775 [Draconibacterium sp.]|nr:hypothetical protein [Draconibacterium sp.]
MRTIKLGFLLVFVSVMFNSFHGLAQVDKKINDECVLTLRIKVDDVPVDYELTGVEIIKINPAGNLSRTVTFKIPSDNKIMDLANPFVFLRVSATGDFNGDKVEEKITDEFAVLTKSGNLKLVYHMNGKSK